VIRSDRSDTSEQPTLPPPFSQYHLDRAYDEMFQKGGIARPSYEELYQRLLELSMDTLQQRQQAADVAFLN